MTRVFLSTWGQNDNIGDSILRRGLLRTFQVDRPVELHVHVGPKDNRFIESHNIRGDDERYLAALGFRGNEVHYEMRSDWWRAAMTGFARDRTLLVQTAGELVFPRDRPFAGWRTVVGLAAARVRGGAGVQVGAGMRSPDVRPPVLERMARRQFAVVAWRDAATRDAFGVGDVAPDWAYDEGSLPADHISDTTDSSRVLLAVTLRGDRPAPTDDLLERLRETADRLSLELQVYTQVRRDRERAYELAERLSTSTEPIVFGEETHVEWEERMRALYRRSRAVASDRAHALIIGATEGAIPLAFSGGSTEKAQRVLAPAGLRTPDRFDIEAVVNSVQSMLDDPRSIARSIAAAQQRIAELRERLRDLL